MAFRGLGVLFHHHGPGDVDELAVTMVCQIAGAKDPAPLKVVAVEVHHLRAGRDAGDAVIERGPLLLAERGQRRRLGRGERERVALDYRITGIPTGPQIMQFYREDLDRRQVLSAIALADHRHGEVVRVAGAIVVKQHPETAKGHVFLSLEDETGMANIIIRPATYQKFKRVLDSCAAVVVTGPLQQVDGVISVLATRLDGLDLFVELKSRDWH